MRPGRRRLCRLHPRGSGVFGGSDLFVWKLVDAKDSRPRIDATNILGILAALTLRLAANMFTALGPWVITSCATRSRTISLKNLSDRGDRYEGSWTTASTIVTVSVDKETVDTETEAKLQGLHDDLQATLVASQQYFLTNRARFGVDYIDDLSDPQIILEKDTYSVYWWSDKGEPNGECVIGIEFLFSTRIPFNLNIGD